MNKRNTKDQALTSSTFMLSEKQAAEHLNRAVGTLRNWRMKNGSNVLTPYTRNDKNGVFYKFDDVMAIAESKSAKRTEKLHKFPRIDILLNDSPLPDIDPPTMLTTAEAALVFGISKASLQIWRSKRQFLGVLPHYGVCQDIHYLASDLTRFIHEGRSYWRALSVEQNRQYLPRTKLSA